MKAKDQKFYNELLEHARENMKIIQKIIKENPGLSPQLSSMLALNYGAANASYMEAALLNLTDVSNRLKIVEAALGLLGSEGDNS